MDGKDSFKLINEDGVEVICDVLFTFDSVDTGKSYIVYTDNTIDEYGDTQVYASIYDPTSDVTKLEPIETEKEWKMIEVILNTLQENIQKGNNIDINDIIDEVLSDINGHDKDDVMDDFSMYDDYMNEFLDKYMTIKLHFYEKQNITHQSTHAFHKKIGEVTITGDGGKFTIGSSAMSDIRIKKYIEQYEAVKHIHIMGVLHNKQLYISNISNADATLNHMQLPNSMTQEYFYKMNHKQYFTLGNRIKVYVELLDQYKIDEKKCPSCGQTYFAADENDEYCVDCFKKYEEEMELDLSAQLKAVEIDNLLYPRMKDDLSILIEPSDKKNSHLLSSLFER